MRILLFSFFMIAVNFSNICQAEDLPFTEYYGKYKIAEIKKIESSNLEPQWLKKTSVEIVKAPPTHGAPHSRLLFFPLKRPNVYEEVEETFSPQGETSSEYYKYEKDKEGFDHYYLRVTANSVKYVYTDVYMKFIESGLLKVKIKKRETLVENGTETGSYNYELSLKRNE